MAPYQSLDGTGKILASYRVGHVPRALPVQKRLRLRRNSYWFEVTASNG